MGLTGTANHQCVRFYSYHQLIIGIMTHGYVIKIWNDTSIYSYVANGTMDTRLTISNCSTGYNSN